jgi:hypothetical protein
MILDDPSLIPNAINEAVRIESPIRGFTRYLAADTQVGDTLIPKGGRALMLYASANRDERRWDDPAKFDVKRILTDHVGFGHGIHSCAGMQLARLEIRSIVTAMTRRVKRIEVGAPLLAMNNVLRGYTQLPVRFIPSWLLTSENIWLLPRLSSVKRLLPRRWGSYRAILIERGIMIAKGRRKLEVRLGQLLAGEMAISRRIRILIEDMRTEWRALDARIVSLDAELAELSRTDVSMKLLTTIPGIGPLNATAFVASVEKAETFGRGRDLAA